MNDVVSIRPMRLPFAELRQVVATWSIVSIGLGASFALITVMVAWVSTPATLSLSPFGPYATLIRGGQAFAEIAPAVRQELGSAVLLLVGGFLGLLSSRGVAQPMTLEAADRDWPGQEPR